MCLQEDCKQAGPDAEERNFSRKNSEESQKPL